MKMQEVLKENKNLIEGGFYWIKYRDTDNWEIGRYRSGNFKLTDGSRIEVDRLFKIDYNPIIKK